MEMSFLGIIGHLMAGSGLQELLEIVYDSNSVCHMLTGKAISGAVRGHMLKDAALNTILVADAYNVPVPTKDTPGVEEETVGAELEKDAAGLQDLQQGDVVTAATDLSV